MGNSNLETFKPYLTLLKFYKMKIFLALIIAIIINTTIYGQGAFVKELPMRGFPVDIVYTHDSCFVVLARTNHFQNSNSISVLKFNNYGDTLWTRTFKLPTPNFFQGGSIVEIPDTGFVIVCNYRDIPFTLPHGVVFFLDTAGTLINWVKLQTGFGQNYDDFKECSRFYQGSFLVSGGQWTNGLLWNLSFSGNIIDTVSVDSMILDYSSLLYHSPDTFIVCSQHDSSGHKLQRLYSLDLNLNRIDSLKLESYKNKYIISDNNFIYLLNENGDSIVFVDHNLNILQSDSINNFKFIGFLSQTPTDFITTNDGYLIQCGYVSNSFGSLVYIIKFDKFGNILFKKPYFGVNASFVAGIVESYDSSLVMIQSGAPDSTNVPKMWLVKADSNGSLTNINDIESKSTLYDVFPNPSKGDISIINHSGICTRIIILNSNGIEVFKDTFCGNNYSISDLNLSSGNYFIKFLDNSTEKVLEFKSIIISN
ncbi:MAG: T9SS type A sorting domain-containing protein [Bacteroidetes bacterium]|nr:T9SS type A sorting domain-containing protein [Bacteroidota bacterium]